MHGVSICQSLCAAVRPLDTLVTMGYETILLHVPRFINHLEALLRISSDAKCVPISVVRLHVTPKNSACP